jgi:hypothetical protein
MDIPRPSVTPICDKHSFVPMGIQFSAVIPLSIGHDIEIKFHRAEKELVEAKAEISRLQKQWEDEAWKRTQ